jgi:hypothetical protein
MSGSSVVCALRARCVQQKSPVETNPNPPSRGRKIRHGVAIMRETAWVVFAGRAFIQPQARFTLPGGRCIIPNITISKISNDIKGVPIWP